MSAKAPSTLIEQAKLQGRVIFALAMRETITRFGREGLGAFWLMAEPALFVVGVMFIFSRMDSGSQYPVAEMLAISYPTLLFWRNGTARITKAIEINRALLHHTPIRPIDILYARILLEFSGSAASFFALYIIFIAIGICHPPADTLTMALGYLLVIWFSFSFVLTMAALADLSDTIERLSHVILYLMLPLCGVFLPLFAVPQPYRGYLLYFPLVDAVEFFRHGYYGSSMRTYYNIPYTLLTLLGMMLFALALTNISIRKTQLDS